MNSALSTLLLGIGGAAIGLNLIVVAVIARRLFGMPARRVRYEIADASIVPPYMLTVFQTGARELEPLGFREEAIATDLDVFGGASAAKYCAVLRNEEKKTCAIVRSRQGRLDYAFNTALSDGTCLITRNGVGWAFIGSLPRTNLQDHYVGTLAEHWQAHLAVLDHLPIEQTPVDESAAQWAEQQTAMSDEYIDSLVRSGTLGPAEDGTFRFNLLGSVKSAFVLRWGALRRQGFLGKVARAPAVPLPVEAEVDQYASASAQPAGLSRNNKLIVLAGSVIASVIAFPAIGIRSATDGVIILGVLLFHELGHWLAMIACGYRDTSIFFVPFLGAATTGKSDGVSTARRVIVYLSGPIPGFLIGGVLLSAAWLPLHLSHTLLPYSRYTQMPAIMLVAVNGFNLLPFPMLDGGQVLKLLVFSRFPYAEALFRVMAVSAVAWAGIHFQMPWLIFLAAVVAIGIRATFAMSRLTLVLQRARAEGVVEPRALQTKAFEWFRNEGPKGMPFASRVTLIRTALQEANPAGPAATVALLAVYCSVVAVPAVFASRLMLRANHNIDTMAAEHEAKCGAGNDRSCAIAGAMLSHSEDPAKKARGEAALRRGCDHGDSGCCFYTAADEAKSEDPAVLSQAVVDYTKACTKETPYGCGGLGHMYMTGKGTHRDPVAAERVLSGTCAGKWPPSECIELADVYRSGDGLPRDAARAASLYEKECSHIWMPEAAKACNALSTLYAAGDGVTKDDAKAKLYAHRADCAKGGMKACPEEWKQGHEEDGEENDD